MEIKNLEDFLFAVEPRHYSSVKAAMSKTGLSEYQCRKYLNQAVTSGLYKKEFRVGIGKNVSPNHRFVRKYRYFKITASDNSTAKY